MEMKYIIYHLAYEAYARGVFAGTLPPAENGGIITRYDLGALFGRFLR